MKAGKGQTNGIRQARRRDLLIEFLHLLQDAHGHLSARHLRALAEEMCLTMAEVWEVATFYAHSTRCARMTRCRPR